jgi:hypothetical protein
MPFLTKEKTNWKYILIVLILAAIVGGGIFSLKLKSKIDDNHYKQMAVEKADFTYCEKIKNLKIKDDCLITIARKIKDISICEKIKEKSLKNYCLRELKEKIALGNKVDLTHTQEGGKNYLNFKINFEDYSIKSIDLSEFGPEFSEYGSQSILPSVFEFPSPLSFIRVETGNLGEKCKPEIPYLTLEIDLPLNSQIEVKMVDFKEEKIEEKLSIVPMIVCLKSSNEHSQCEPCPNYLKENEFFPSKFEIYSDKSHLEEKETLRISLPLIRHNPSTRETYKIKSAEIKVEYTLSKTNSVIIEKESVPTEINSLEDFTLEYRVINPSLERIENLKLKANLKDPHGNILTSINSEVFNLDGEELKKIPISMRAPCEGNYLLEVSAIKDSSLKGVGKSEYIRFHLPIEFEVPTPPSVLTINDFLSAIVRNKGKEIVKVDVHFEILDPHHINVGKLYSTPKQIDPGKEEKFQAQVSGPLTNYCQKGDCTALAYAKVDYGSCKEKFLGPIYFTVKSFLPNYCEKDQDCVCCDFTQIDYPYERNVSVNQTYAQRYNCISGEFCSKRVAFCDKKTFECKNAEWEEFGKVKIMTDKKEYNLGEKIKIKVRNDSEKSIWMFPISTLVHPGWYLQKSEDGTWRKINFTFPTLEAGLGIISKHCELAPWEKLEPFELASGNEISIEWDTSKEICQWPSEFEKTLEIQPQLIEPGIYRIFVIYGMDKFFTQAKVIYSESFEIKK